MALKTLYFPARGEITHNMLGPDVNYALDVAGDDWVTSLPRRPNPSAGTPTRDRCQTASDWSANPVL